jgi:hypothetical protein
MRVPQARYAYYRRCQVFRKGGEQCKAPAEKGSLICHAHAAQTAMAVRREQQRRAVLEEAVAELRHRGNPECEMRDLFMDFKGIQATLAVMAQALIDGRIDCKTAGRLVVNLQMVSKLLWMQERQKRKSSPLIRTDATDLKKSDGNKTGNDWIENQREGSPIDLTAKVQEFATNWCRLPHGPPGWARAA